MDDVEDVVVRRGRRAGEVGRVEAVADLDRAAGELREEAVDVRGKLMSIGDARNGTCAREVSTIVRWEVPWAKVTVSPLQTRPVSNPVVGEDLAESREFVFARICDADGSQMIDANRVDNAQLQCRRSLKIGPRDLRSPTHSLLG